ncbi:MAG: hypothetical protein WD696_16135 [Bryobacteraceae bacterium]
MFDSLSDQIRKDQVSSTTLKERVLRWIAVAVLSVAIFGGLYMSMKLLEG